LENSHYKKLPFAACGGIAAAGISLKHDLFGKTVSTFAGHALAPGAGTA
jgi:hypothetical protein